MKYEEIKKIVLDLIEKFMSQKELLKMVDYDAISLIQEQQKRIETCKEYLLNLPLIQPKHLKIDLQEKCKFYETSVDEKITTYRIIYSKLFGEKSV